MHQLITPTVPADSKVRSLRSIDPATIEEMIPRGDALLQLPRPTLAVLVTTLGVTREDMLLKVPDARILAELKAREQCGNRLLTDIAIWLTRQREARDEGLWEPAKSKAFADKVLGSTPCDVARAISEAVHSQDIAPEDLAKRCATSREAVVSLLAGAVPANLELVLRMASAPGIDVEIRVADRLQ